MASSSTHSPGASASRRASSDAYGPTETMQNPWAVFAGVILMLNGCLAVFYGLAAVLNDQVITVGGQGAVLWDLTAWGWITLGIGTLMLLTGFGLIRGSGAARWLGVLFCSLHILAMFPSASAFPLWSILVIMLDVVIIYQLITRYERA